MSRSVVIRRNAKRQIEEAFDWYESQASGLDDDFLVAVESVLTRMKETPLLYAQVYRDVHRALLPRFPYGLFFMLIRIELWSLLCRTLPEIPSFGQ
jgi:plasmid stabilization system protein ParE